MDSIALQIDIESVQEQFRRTDDVTQDLLRLYQKVLASVDTYAPGWKGAEAEHFRSVIASLEGRLRRLRKSIGSAMDRTERSLNIARRIEEIAW